jgi:hypothetical protein
LSTPARRCAWATDRVFACVDFAASVAARSRGLISCLGIGQISGFLLEILAVSVNAALIRFIFPDRSLIRRRISVPMPVISFPLGLSVCASWRTAPGLIFLARLSTAGFDFLLTLLVLVTAADFCSPAFNLGTRLHVSTWDFSSRIKS